MGTTQIFLALILISLFVTAVIFGIKKFADPSRIIRKYESSKEKSNVFVKKYKEADLETYRGPAIRVGFVVVLVMMIFVFNYAKQEKSEKINYKYQEEEIIEQDIPITKQVRPQLPPPPPPPPQIVIVRDERVIEAEVVFEDTEVDLDEEIEVIRDTSSNIKVEVPAMPEYDDYEEPEIFTVVEHQPVFPGGLEALMAYLSTSIKYPPIALENSIQGTVVIRFVVSETGSISAIKIIKEIGGGCGSEAVRVVSEMPDWAPGRQRGKPVKVYYTLPVRFKLQ